MALFLARVVDLWAEQDGPYQDEDNGVQGLPLVVDDGFGRDVPPPERGVTFVRPGEYGPSAGWRVGFVPASAVVLPGGPGSTEDQVGLRFRPEVVDGGVVDLASTLVRVTHVDAQELATPSATVDVGSAPYAAS